MGVGRFVCVAVPLILTISSLVALLIATLSGVAHNSLWIFEINTQNMSISPLDAAHLAGKAGLGLRANAQTDNITAAQLQLANVYQVHLWGYCYGDGKNQRQCTEAKFDWASQALNSSLTEELTSLTGVKIKLPDGIQTALKTFRTVAKWTEVAFIVALAALAVELLVGVFAMCSRVVSCVVWLASGVTALLVVAAAGLSTAMASVVIGAVDGTAKYYGVKGQIGGRFLAAVWLAAAFAIAAAFFWIFTICCCKPEARRSQSRGRRQVDSDGGEKLLPAGSYRPISGNNFEMRGGHHDDNTGYYSPGQKLHDFHTGYQPGPRHPAGQERTELAYEPYSHRV
ncbi:uncharacterized protein UV8b_02681 [Ustilaginoidea virens]|uniref:Uncharacterized protein n=1 Tax=Ustilaginoidea virens TaxID=1159556 RepID=A0A063C819_USTVR|nr:uncharacterized protein UV8b_02681 [Ustilaginoidea virens]QUC18440.1 hypothetical protein UV8b_02681 [Ustilaginoidea virens]GAO14465.1 hypothetical protein UVI_02031430 [Ustilaginoidea virens]